MTLPEKRLSIEAAGLAQVVRRENHMLTRETLDRVYDFYAKNVALPDFESSLTEIMPEYGRSEYLLCVNHDGLPEGFAAEMGQQFDEMRRRHPGFGKWFQADGEMLLPARWLCHLAGIRHRAVQLFIDDPHRVGYTLVQVRSAEKAEAPGCFDIPVAGHVDFRMEGEESLFKEMHEELALDRQDLEEFTFITGYDAIDDVRIAGFHSAEYRLVWRGRLKKAAWEKITPGINEVAGIASISKEELPRMIKRFPERFASGIKASLPYCLNQ